MDTIINFPRRFTLYAAAMALAALVITLLAVNMTAGPAQAQNADNTYPAPQPCGPGAGTAFQPEPHEISEGHFALFDSYWEWRETDPNEGVMHTNECPPKMVTSGRGGKTITRTESNIDIGEAIFHVTEDYKTTVVASNAEATSGQLSLEDYSDVGQALNAGDEVWWLRLDDPDISGNETSDLTLGFSTALFDKKYWLTREDGKPMRYMFETERYPGSDPMNVPHFFTYEAPKRARDTGTNEDRVERVWDSTRVHLDPMLMDPGEYRPVQWVFTKPGTYILSVHLLGHVRKTEPTEGAGENWAAISSDDHSETGEVKKYVFQVGNLTEMEPPLFGVNPSVKENSPAGTRIGDPIPVYRSEADILQYNLTGTGSDAFTLMPTTDPHSVQIAVASGADLDYETRDSYDLILEVTDNVDHEDNPDATVDDILAVNIDLEDIPTGVSIHASNNNPRPGDTVTFTGEIHDLDPDDVEWFGYTFSDSRGGHVGDNRHSVHHSDEATETIGLIVSYLPKGGTAPDDVEYLSASITISWSNP